MSTYVSDARFANILTLPISLPQTELRRGGSIQAAILPLNLGESFELRSLTLHLLKILTPGVLPVLNNTSLGLLSVGVYLTPMLTGSAAIAFINSPGAVTYNPSAPARYSSPGLYRVIVSNNCSNLDLSVIVAGSVKLFR